MIFGDGGTDSLARAMVAWREQPWLFDAAMWPDAPPDAWQAQVWRKIGWHNPGAAYQSRIGMQSCAGAGKSAQLARMILWAGTCLGEPNFPVRVVCASMTGGNLKAGLWRELKLWINRSHGGFLKELWEVKSEQIRHRFVEDCTIDARSWPARANPDEVGDVLSGIHDRYQIYAIDESGSIFPQVRLRCEQGMGDPGQWGAIWTAGNPADPDSMLGSCARAGYEMVRITADPDDPDRTPRKSREYAQQMIDEAALGREDPWVRVYILGLFPVGGVDRLLSHEAFDEARERMLPPGSQDTFARVMGLDVGREIDPSVLYRRQGSLILPEPHVWRGLDGLEGATRVNRVWSEWDADACLIDMTGGWGTSWYDQLRAMQRNPMSVVYSTRADEPERYSNKRSEMLWRVREGVLSTWQLPSLNTRGAKELEEEATETRYSIVQDRVCIEKKDHLKARLGRSPNHVDALGNTVAYSVGPRVRGGGYRMIGAPTVLVPDADVPNDWS